MLSLPHTFPRSVNCHRIESESFSDWVLASNLLMEEHDELSDIDVVGYLLDMNLYDEQDFALEYVSEKWGELKRRHSWLGEYSPVSFEDRRMSRELAWNDVPAYSYCLIVSFGSRCEGWHDKFGPDYDEQGRLFELITKAAMRAQFNGWRFFHTGWSRDNASTLSTVIGKLTSFLGERKGGYDDYLSRNAKEVGVDLVWHLPFEPSDADRRPGAPVYLAQCASGRNWPSKIHEPNLRQWMKIVDFAVKPSKAFSLPFALGDRELRNRTNEAGALLLDRYRLLARSVSEEMWVPEELREALAVWLEPRVEWLLYR